MSKYKLPPVLSGQESKNSETVIPTRAKDMKYIRATSLNYLRDCPTQFYEKYCKGVPQPTGKGRNYALIGTIFHEIIEHYIIHKWELSDTFFDEIIRALDEHDIRHNEILALGKYLNRIRDFRQHTRVVEWEFEYTLVPGLPKIKGHIDWICNPPNDWIIIDHKTNRQPKPLEKWMDDLQTMTYSWAVRKKIGLNVPLQFIIGYVNLPYDTVWTNFPVFDDTLRTWYYQAWNELLYMEATGHFKRTACDTCKYCPEQGKCKEEKKGKTEQKNMLNAQLYKLGLK